MAFTRKALEAMGIEPAKIDQIMDLHVEVTDALKRDRDSYRADAEKLVSVQQELDALKAKGDGGFEDKYNREHTAFEAYKKQIQEEAVTAEKKTLYAAMLKDMGVSEGRIGAIVRVTDFSVINVKDHALDGIDALKENAKKEWADFITSSGVRGAGVDNPPAGSGGLTKDTFNAMTLSERMAYANEHPAEAAALMN